MIKAGIIGATGYAGRELVICRSIVDIINLAVRSPYRL